MPPREAVGGHGDRRSPGGVRTRVAARLMLGSTAGIGVVGLLDWQLRLPLLAGTIGPTIYVFVAHPRRTGVRLPFAALAHAIALSVGLVLLAVFGLWHGPNAVEAGHVDGRQVAASAIGVGVVLLVMELVGSHHAPAGATLLLVTTGLAMPGRPLVGLTLGLAVALAMSPLLVRAPPAPRPDEPGS